VKVTYGADGSATDASPTNPLPVTASVQTLTNPVVTRVAASVTNVTLLAANTARRAAYYYNDSTAVLYLKLGATASATSHTVQIPGGGFYELPTSLYVYVGIVDGLWASATGAVCVTEVS
jgi:hypothetical protein